MSKGKVAKRIFIGAALLGVAVLVVRKLRRSEQTQMLWETAADSVKGFAQGAQAAASAVADNVRESAGALHSHEG